MAFGGTLGGKKKNPFTSTPGKENRNKVTVGQNLPNLTGTPAVGDAPRRTRSYGPAVLGLQRLPPQESGPGDPPPDFIGGTNSLSEWMFYWACLKVLGPEGDRWDYQSSQLGGRQQQGGAVVDFVIKQNVGRRVGVRIQTYRFHFNVDAFKQAGDVAQLLALSSPDFIVIDVFEDQFIHDPTGQSAINLVVEVINERQRMNPLGTGLVVGSG